jgi:hypothetical protein
MDEVMKIAMLDNEVQEELLESLLVKAGIPHVMRSYHDSAFDGLFQGDKFWGHVEAPEKYKAAILEMMADIKAKNSGAMPLSGE